MKKEIDKSSENCSYTRIISRLAQSSQEESKMSGHGHGHETPEEDHTVCIKVGIFFVCVIVGFFVIGLIN
jgi:hypothetical protein